MVWGLPDGLGGGVLGGGGNWKKWDNSNSIINKKIFKGKKNKKYSLHYLFTQ